MSDRRLIRDLAGREVALPARLEKVLPTGNPAAAAIYCIAPDRLMGWPEPIPGQTAPISAHLPEVPRLNAYELEKSVRAVRAAAPDLVLDFGNCGEAFVRFADGLQAETGIPVAIVDGHLARTDDALSLLGRLFDVPERTEELSRTWHRVSAGVNDALARRKSVPRVHYAIGARGEKTVRRDSIHLEGLDMLGAENVAEVAAGIGGRVRVDPRDVARWDPDMILTIDPAFHANAATLDVWGDMRAVRAGRVYLAPAPILSWFDFPPSLNRVIGLPWLARLFHGDVYQGDLMEEAQVFHRLFYAADIERDAVAAMLAKAGVG